MAPPTPSPDAPGVKFQAFLAEGSFSLQVCDGCGTQIFFPRTLCPSCGSRALTWKKASGEGTVYSTTTVRQKPERGGDYNVSIVELAEGARMMSRVEGVEPAAVTIGMAVTAVIATDDAGPLVVFRPAEGGGA
ncbi:Zn-ribbon domain-containing OB-fold protein [Afifella sp. IM 167]|uniref:Zn-ribbon domain-containing OB-fold protein n=1 Tax=Afifella sp. IM 167 TaxID=2033586 RepID=UPI001CC93601|nr:OB-fold domain-containing protein [Afifella sp. IM 167]MBZ8134794.1 DNA-binding protein [Afifella sp. IM 167]